MGWRNIRLGLVFVGSGLGFWVRIVGLWGNCLG